MDRIAAVVGLSALFGSASVAAAPATDRGRPEVASVPWTLAEPAEDEPAPQPETKPVSVTAKRAAEPAPSPVPTGSRLRPPREMEHMSAKPIGRGNVAYKPGKGLVLESDNGKYMLAMNVAAQFLYTLEHEGKPAEGAKPTTNTFELRRARLFFIGHVFNPHVKYWVQLQFAPRDLGLSDGKIQQSPVFQWQATFDFLRDFTPQVGLNFIPYARQRVAPILKLQMIDNSIASYEFTLDRDIGINFMSKDVGGLGRLRYYAGVFMGEGPHFAKKVDFGLIYNGRIEVLPFGDFDDYAEADHARLLEPKLSIGAAYAFADNDARNRALGVAPTDGGTTDTHNVTVDVVFKMAGFSLLADAYYRQGWRNYGDVMVTDPNGSMNYAPEAPRNGVGWTAQAGYLIPKVAFEIAGRYSGIRPVGSYTSLIRRDEAGPGLSYYFLEHSIKLQLDYLHIWSETQKTDQVRLQLTLGF